MKKDQKVVVSVHDVAPPFLGELETILRSLEKRETPATFLIVPNWEHKNDISSEKYPDFSDFLGEVFELGHEIALHGYSHSCVRRPSHPIKLLMSRVGQYGDEFQNMGVDEARTRIKMSKEALRQVLPIEPEGFVPPVWLTNDESLQAIKENFSYTTSYLDLMFNDDGEFKTIRSPVIAYYPLPEIVDPPLRLYAKLLRIYLRDFELVRLAVHPMDLHGLMPFRDALTIIEDFKDKGKDFVTYNQFLESRRN